MADFFEITIPCFTTDFVDLSRHSLHDFALAHGDKTMQAFLVSQSLLLSHTIVFNK